MSSVIWAMSITGILTGCVMVGAQVYTSPDEAREHPLFALQGEFAGSLVIGEETYTLAMQLAARGDKVLEGLLYTGGLPGDGGTHEESVPVKTARDDGFEIKTAPYKLVPVESGWVITHEQGASAKLERVERQSPRLGVAPPPGGILLFNGAATEHLEKVRITEEGLLREGAETVGQFDDALIHVEFILPYMPSARGQGRANSGVYIQNRYEVQILDSFAETPTIDGGAAFYREKPAIVNMSFPPLTWQTYDIIFRAPRFNDEGEKTSNARFTVFHNGVMVHDAVELTQGTGAGRRRGEIGPGPIIFQDHGNPVHFRNLWIVPGEFEDLGGM